MKYSLLLILCSVVFSTLSAQHVESEIPYRLVGGKMIIDMKMNGQMRSFIFDTGGQTSLTQEVCQELGLPDYAPIQITDVNGQKGSYERVLIEELVDVNTLFAFRKVPAIVIPAPSPFECFHVDGLIGSDILKSFMIEIDGKKKIIKLISTTKNVSPSLRKMLPFAQSGFMPIINLQVGAGNSITVLFDTGCPGFLNLKDADFEKLRESGAFQIKSVGYSEGSIGLGGMAATDTSYRVVFPLLSIGPSRFQHVSSQTSPHPYTLLGVKLLDYGKVTIDYSRSRFYFELYEEEEVKMNEVYYPFSLRVKDGDLVVSAIWDKKYSYLSIGDKVTRINGKTVDKFDFCESIINGVPELKHKKTNKLTIQTREGEKVVLYKKK